jgi:hypothetical protein
MRRKLKLILGGGNSCNRNCKLGCGGACGGVWRRLRLVGIWSKAVDFQLLRIQVLAVANVKVTVFWDVALRSFVEIDRLLLPS